MVYKFSRLTFAFGAVLPVGVAGSCVAASDSFDDATPLREHNRRQARQVGPVGRNEVVERPHNAGPTGVVRAQAP